MFKLKLFCGSSRRVFNAVYAHQAALSMQAWQANEYGNPDVLNLNILPSVPIITKPSDILIKVHAASVNPIDVMMLRGYGASIVGVLKQLNHLSLKPSTFPLTLGRDFSGTVVRVGSFVKSLKPGDEVWGVVGVEQSGSHAEYVVTSSYYTTKKPASLNDIEAASLPYASLTAWSAISTFGGLTSTSTYGKRALVLGASGGVGTLAVQILKAWGAHVTAVCSTDAMELVQNLRVDEIIDYQLQDLQSEIKQLEKFDFIFDAVGARNMESTLEALKKWKNSKYVTIVSPVLKNADKYGLIFGTMKSSAEAARHTLMGLKDGRSARWAYCIPNGWALKTISEMVDNKMISPVIDKVFKFEDTPDAYRKIIDGHARGKTVISNIQIPQEYVQEQPTLEEGPLNEKIQASEKS